MFDTQKRKTRRACKKVGISFDEKLCHTRRRKFRAMKKWTAKLRLSAFEQVERLSETKTKGGAQQLNYERFWVGKENLRAVNVLLGDVKINRKSNFSSWLESWKSLQMFFAKRFCLKHQSRQCCQKEILRLKGEINCELENLERLESTTIRLILKETTLQELPSRKLKNHLRHLLAQNR